MSGHGRIVLHYQQFAAAVVWNVQILSRIARADRKPAGALRPVGRPRSALAGRIGAQIRGGLSLSGGPGMADAPVPAGPSTIRATATRSNATSQPPSRWLPLAGRRNWHRRRRRPPAGRGAGVKRVPTGASRAPSNLCAARELFHTHADVQDNH